MAEESGENIKIYAEEENEHNKNKLDKWIEFMGGHQKKNEIKYAGKKGSDK